MIALWSQAEVTLSLASGPVLDLDLFSLTSWQMKADSHLQFPGKTFRVC